MELRSMKAGDWEEVAEIYMQGIATGIATFETAVPAYETWDRKHLAYCRIIAEIDKEIQGWAALSPVSSRCVYDGVAEVSVYVRNTARGKGIGRKLLAELVRVSEEHGIWTLQSGIFPQNKASIQVHKELGFRLVGRREKVAKLKGTWYDNLVFEKRSTNVGID
ncbi:N-acetyltransferase family protein [Zeaxanthinibacter enoshimensis]|uniref:GNAT family N-acetyltransferase n=1 Tax=Zeaxanthinibacter enoshimensis TaxID=392009 RepID=UPI00356786FB